MDQSEPRSISKMGKNDVIKLTRKIRIGAPGILYLNVELYLVKTSGCMCFACLFGIKCTGSLEQTRFAAYSELWLKGRRYEYWLRDGRHGPGQSSYKNIHTYILIPSHKRCLYMEYLNSCAVASLMLVQGPHGGPNSPMDLTPCRNFPICLIVTIITTSRFISYRIRPSDGAWLRVDRLYVDFIHLVYISL